jgi:hypothetical protein
LAINGVVACRNALDSDVAVGDYAEENVVIPHRQYAYVVELHLLCSQLNSVIGPNATGVRRHSFTYLLRNLTGGVWS